MLGVVSVAAGLTVAKMVLDLAHPELHGGFWMGGDSDAYWQAWHAGSMYHGSELIYSEGVYLYSPAFAQAIWPIGTLPWLAFRAATIVVATLAYAWLIRPAPRALWPAYAFLAVSGIGHGNIEWILGVVVVIGLRYPAAWSMTLLTKITPGVGLIWFVARREWSKLAIALAATGALVLASLALDPSLWLQWIGLLTRNLTEPHREGLIGFLPLRVVAAAVIVVVGARWDWRPALLVGTFLATPDVNFSTLALLCALPRLLAGGTTGELQGARIHATVPVSTS